MYSSFHPFRLASCHLVRLDLSCAIHSLLPAPHLGLAVWSCITMFYRRPIISSKLVSKTRFRPAPFRYPAKA